jgi:hypothetical protein
MVATFHFGLGYVRSNGERTPRPIVGAILPGSHQAFSLRHGVGGETREAKSTGRSPP